MVAVTEISTLLQTAPTTTGVPIGSGDWQLHVERLSGDPEGGVWDVSTWGTDENDADAGIWATYEWESLNDVLRGMEWFRGADAPNGRPRVGEITLTLFNDTDGMNDPWVNYPNTRPGTIIRAGLTSATDVRADGWLPLWTGVVDSWPVKYEAPRESGYRADSFATVTLVETLSWLARIDENALGSPQGSGDLISERVDRLLTAADWPYGLVTLFGSGGESTIDLQSTDMSLNRLAELYLSADSTASIVRSDVTGACVVADWSTIRDSRLIEFSSTNFGFGDTPILVLAAQDEGVGGWTLAYDADSVETANDPEGIVNDHRYTRVGGSQQLFDHPASIGAFGRSTRARNDLICATDGDALFLAEEDNDREALTALRVERVDVTATDRPLALLGVAAADVGDSLWMFPPAAVEFTGSGIGRLRSMTHFVTPLKGRVHWTASYAIDFYVFTDVIGAELPPA